MLLVLILSCSMSVYSFQFTPLKLGIKNIQRCISVAIIGGVGLLGSCDTFVSSASASAAVAEAASTTIVSPFTNDKTIVPVYFGLGCFWHIQHEFVQTEVRVLQRSALDFSRSFAFIFLPRLSFTSY